MGKPTVVSLFSGIGGIDFAFKQVGFEIIWANDIDKFACVTYLNNFADTDIVCADISQISAERIPKADVLVAGFPCQSFSLMGYQRGFKDPRGNLFFEIARVADAIKPKVIFLENVRNLIYHDNGRTFITIFNTLAELGYEVKYDVENACTHGNIPQERRRTFIVAFLNLEMLDRFSFPKEIELTKSIDSIINRSIKHNDIYYYSLDSKYYTLLNSRIIDKTGIYRIDDSGVAKKKYDISPTLKANMGTYHDRVPIIRDDYGIRKLTPYECLALQGFSDDFKFSGIPIEQAYKQCGNTVCVPVVKRIVDHIYKAEFGGYVTGPKVVSDQARAAMRKALSDIQDGSYAKNFLLENQVGAPMLRSIRAQTAAHPIEVVGARLRSMMPFISAHRHIDRSKN